MFAIEFDCGDPTSNLTLIYIEFASGSPPIKTFMEIAMVKCMTGAHWDNGSTIKNIACQSTGIWTSVTPCTRNFLIKFKPFMYQVKSEKVKIFYRWRFDEFISKNIKYFKMKLSN